MSLLNVNLSARIMVGLVALNCLVCTKGTTASPATHTCAHRQGTDKLSQSDRHWRRLSKLQTPIYGVRVLNGREIAIAGTRCRLFGVRLPDDETMRAKARRFLELYMADYGAYFFIYNIESPVNGHDGVPLVWLQGSGNGGWAQETLVQAGLAVVDYTGFEDYKFRVPGKSGDLEYDWKKCLQDAESYRAAGKKPDVNFTWPEQSALRRRAMRRYLTTVKH